MTQRLKHLPCKQEDQSLGPQDPHKHYMGVMACLQFQPQQTVVRCLRTGPNQLVITVSQQALDLIQKPHLQELSRRGIKKESQYQPQVSTNIIHMYCTHIHAPPCVNSHTYTCGKKKKKRPRKQKRQTRTLHPAQYTSGMIFK